MTYRRGRSNGVAWRWEMAEIAGFRIARLSPERTSEVPYDENRFYELVLYIADAFKKDPAFGRIKLAKLIFNADVRGMRQFGRPVSGASYRKDTWGHNPIQLLLAELDLQAADLADIVIGEGEEEPRFIAHDDRRRLIPRRRGRPDLSPEDAQIVDAVIEEYREAPAKAMSDESHKTVSWQIVQMRDEIPVEMLLVAKPTERDLAEGQAVAERLGLARD